MELYVQKLKDEAILPHRATEGSAGLDLSACIDRDIPILPGMTIPIPTGLAAAIPAGYGGFLFARSGLATKHRLIPANCVGVIDADYRGEIFIPLSNVGGKTVTISPGMRIAQLILLPVPEIPVTLCDALPHTKRDTGGFGSTGQ